MIARTWLACRANDPARHDVPASPASNRDRHEHRSGPLLVLRDVERFVDLVELEMVRDHRFDVELAARDQLQHFALLGIDFAEGEASTGDELDFRHLDALPLEW